MRFTDQTYGWFVMTTAAVKKGTDMTEFIYALFDPYNKFLRLALFVGLLACLPFGIIGSYIITRRISYIAGAISHCAFGGIGAALYLQKKCALAWFDPIIGAVLSAVLAAVIIGLISLFAKEREDTVIGALWAVGMAAGLLCLDLTPGYYDITSYLFGDILLITRNDLWLVLCLDIIVFVFSVFFYNKLLAICFDDEYARLRGINSDLFYILLLCLCALTIVLLVRVVGIVMVIALLTLPPAIAGRFVKRLWQMMILSVILCMIFIFFGMSFSYLHDLSSGPTIIVFAGVTYLLAVSITRIYRMFTRKS